jgi:quercetin dioxygenase-like cupin family protein
MKEVNFYKIKDLKPKEVINGSTIKAVANEHSMFTYFEFGTNPVMPKHKHPHEQICLVMQGSVKMTVGEQVKTLKVMEGVVIPPNLEHEAIALESNTKVLDVWYPLRKDYL